MDAAGEHDPNPTTARAEIGRSSAPAPGAYASSAATPAGYAPPAPSAAGSPGPALDTPSLERPLRYINRQASCLAFNHRAPPPPAPPPPPPLHPLTSSPTYPPTL